MKVLNKIKKVFLTILLVAFFLFAMLLTIIILYRNDYGLTQFDDTTIVFVKGDISAYDYKKGDVLIVNYTPIDKLKVGEEIFVYDLPGDGTVNIELGTIGEIHLDEKEIAYENGSTYSMELTIGQPSKVYQGVGTVLSMLLSRWGFLFVVLLPCLFIFIYQVYALIVELKYGGEEISDI